MKKDKQEQTEEKETVNESEQNQTEQTADSQTEQAASETEKSESAEKAESEASAEDEAKGEKSSEERIAELEKENADLKDQLLRRAADFDNYRKRMMQEKQDAFDYGNANLLKDLLDSLDNFDRTLDAAKDAKDAKSIADGIKMINKSLVSMLETNTIWFHSAKRAMRSTPTCTRQSECRKARSKKKNLPPCTSKDTNSKTRLSATPKSWW